MTHLKITAGPYQLRARLEEAAAPKTCARFLELLPYHERIIHVRWSGEACWIPLGELDLGLGYENHTSYPAPGQIILYPGGISETEILLAYGGVQFASKMGQLAGNHFLTVTEGHEHLAALRASWSYGMARNPSSSNWRLRQILDRHGAARVGMKTIRRARRSSGLHHRSRKPRSSTRSSAASISRRGSNRPSPNRPPHSGTAAPGRVRRPTPAPAHPPSPAQSTSPNSTPRAPRQKLPSRHRRVG